MNTTRKRVCCSILSIIILVFLFKISVFALKKDKEDSLNLELLNIDILDSMVEKCKNTKVLFTSKESGISLSAPKSYIQDDSDDDLYISSENIEILSLRFDNKMDVSEYIDDMYDYLNYDSINVETNDKINFNIENSNSSVVQYNFEYEDYTYSAYFIVSIYENGYVLTFVGTHNNIDKYYEDIKEIVETIKLN